MTFFEGHWLDVSIPHLRINYSRFAYYLSKWFVFESELVKILYFFYKHVLFVLYCTFFWIFMGKSTKIVEIKKAFQRFIKYYLWFEYSKSMLKLVHLFHRILDKDKDLPIPRGQPFSLWNLLSEWVLPWVGCPPWGSF